MSKLGENEKKARESQGHVTLQYKLFFNSFQTLSLNIFCLRLLPTRHDDPNFAFEIFTKKLQFMEV